MRRHITGDAIEVMDALIEDGERFELILTDPPWSLPSRAYPSGAWRRWSNFAVMASWWRDVVVRLRSLCTDDGAALAFCGGPAVAVFYPPLYERWPLVQLVTWDKQVTGLGYPFRMATEHILAATASTRGYRLAGTQRRTVLASPAVPPAQRVHPAQKPVALLGDLIEFLCPPGGRVLDPFAGSGSTAHAAELAGRECVTIDIDPEAAQW